MITENEVAQAIEECMREPVTGNKRAVLADLIITQDYLFGEPIRAKKAPQPIPTPAYHGHYKWLETPSPCHRNQPRQVVCFPQSAVAPLQGYLYQMNNSLCNTFYCLLNNLSILDTIIPPHQPQKVKKKNYNFFRFFPK